MNKKMNSMVSMETTSSGREEVGLVRYVGLTERNVRTCSENATRQIQSAQKVNLFCSVSVSYTHLTLPTNAEV